jgi:16S rRNA U516 pseudouridylate synthase RsuA-like enzyme
MRVTINIDAKKILSERGLGSSKKVQKYLASEVVRLSDKYVPMQQGMLKNQTQIASDGSQIVYTQPYAHYQYYGEVMAGRAPKDYTGRKLTYNGAPMRGARWTERMLADKRKEIENSVEAYIKRG